MLTNERKEGKFDQNADDKFLQLIDLVPRKEKYFT